MNLVTGVASDELFGGSVDEPVRALIESARQAPREWVSGILWAAQALDPGALPVYFLLYKFHASRGELEQAERAAEAGLRAAGLQTGLPATSDAIEQATPRPEFAHASPARFWLFTVKALAFIRVRQGKTASARHLVAQLARLDPTHSLGADVTAALVGAAHPG